ncbi:unnamed protein product [Mycena citricolor]|uniref:Cytochrome P450 n=1 Tax=Mycena citricolor TaxID=2018698 RepID=A0AAD2HC36_9AGAR|nr:unnamed protein product [Mycena citricolor]
MAAAENDVIPLSGPIVTKSGECVTSIRVAKCTAVAAPLAFLNSALALWSPDAHRFDPGQWWLLQDAPGFPGSMHLAHGNRPRMCLGAGMSRVLIKVRLVLPPAAAII